MTKRVEVARRHLDEALVRIEADADCRVRDAVLRTLSAVREVCGLSEDQALQILEAEGYTYRSSDALRKATARALSDKN